MRFDKNYFSQSHFDLKWPVSVFREELDRLLNGYWEDARDWNDEFSLLLEEAFRYAEPKQEFDRFSGSDWVTSLQHHVEYLPSPQTRRPYWSQRRMQTSERPKLTLEETINRVRDLIRDLEGNGYLAQAFGQRCIDTGEEIGTLGSQPIKEIHRQLGRSDLWPIREYDYTLDDLCDVIELIHDYVARPMKRYYHSYDNCVHYSVFRRGIAQKLYRVYINLIFDENSLDLMLNEHGRFEEVAVDALEPLIAGARSDSSSGGKQHDELQHAIDQFRRRGATETDKRQAIVTLAGILETRRQAIKEHLLKGDEGALFNIANQFNLRHQRADQKTEYDTELYFQRIFYWYLATIRLLDQMLKRQATS